jgi:hypothetical protein
MSGAGRTGRPAARAVDRQFVASLAGFVAFAGGSLAALVALVRWGGWPAAAVLAAAAAWGLTRFYLGARPDLPPPADKEAP